MTTKADYIPDEVYLPIQEEHYQEKSAIWGSGLIADSPGLTPLVNANNVTGEMPKIQDVTFNEGTPNEVKEDRIDPGSASYGIDRYCKFAVNASAQYSGQVEMMTGHDPEDYFTERGSEWFTKKKDFVVINQIKTYFEMLERLDSADTDGSRGIAPFLVDRTVAEGETVTDANRLDGPLGIDAAIDTLGDQFGDLTIVGMHTDYLGRLMKLGLQTQVLPLMNGKSITVGKWLQYFVWFSDGMPKTPWADRTNAAYDLFIGAAGVVRLIQGKPDKGLPSLSWSFDPKAANLAGFAEIDLRLKMLCKIDGMAWNHDIPNTETYPTEARYFNQANWDLVVQPKHIPLVRLRVNL